jgi:hypothetical protein
MLIWMLQMFRHVGFLPHMKNNQSFIEFETLSLEFFVVTETMKVKYIASNPIYRRTRSLWAQRGHQNNMFW